jgi:hypothetical protein
MPRQLHGRAARRVLLRPQKARVQGLPGARAYLLPAPAAVGRSTAPKGPNEAETGCPHPPMDSEPRVGVGGHAGPCTPGGPPPAGCVKFTVTRIRRSAPGPSPQRQWGRAEAASRRPRCGDPGRAIAPARATGAGTGAQWRWHWHGHPSRVPQMPAARGRAQPASARAWAMPAGAPGPAGDGGVRVAASYGPPARVNSRRRRVPDSESDRDSDGDSLGRPGSQAQAPDSRSRPNRETGGMGLGIQLELEVQVGDLFPGLSGPRPPRGHAPAGACCHLASSDYLVLLTRISHASSCGT